MRTIVDLPKSAIDALSEICQQKKISRAEAIRQAVDLYLRTQTPEEGPDAFGLWRTRDKEDGLAYEDRLRNEWKD